MNTGVTIAGRPSLGAWVTYGLGTENGNLPPSSSSPTRTSRSSTARATGAPASCRPFTRGRSSCGGGEPIANLRTPIAVGDDRQCAKLAFLDALNRRHAASRPDLTELDARIKSYELAFRMQAEALEAVDLRGETEATKSLYGMDEGHTEIMGRNCLLARRMVERGVRFCVQVYHGAAASGTREDRAATPSSARDGQTGHGPHQGPQEPRPARQHAGRLGRRVRPHADEREGGRPRPQPHRLHDVDGGRRRRRRHRSARPTRSACTPSRIASTSTTSTRRSCT